MKTELSKQKLASNEVVKLISNFLDTNSYLKVTLVGGAVIDIIEGRKPKDYDFININPSIIKKFIENGFVFQYVTKSAQTFKKGKIIIQFLNADIGSFDFKISQSCYEITKKILTIDEFSFDNKTLIPVNFDNAISALMRIPHWKRKGYTINDLTYLSLLNSLIKAKSLKS